MAEWRFRIGCAVMSAAVVGLAPGTLLTQDEGDGDAQAEKEPERKPRDYQSIQYCLTQYEVERFSELLGLTPPQHKTLMSMFHEVRRQVFDLQRPLSQSIDEMVELSSSLGNADRDEAVVIRAQLEELMERIRVDRERFDSFQYQVVSAFYEDLELLLRPEQLDRLDDAIRWRHRHRLLRWGMIPYSDFSVASVARSMDIRVDAERFKGEEQPSLESIYKEYEIELDRFLMRRVEAERRFASGARGMGGSRSGPSSIDSEEDKEKWRVAVGEVNQRLVNMQKKYIRRIANLLEPEGAAKFQRRCYEKAYWHVLADESMDRLFSELLENPSLTDEQRLHVKAMQADYESAKAPIDREWIRALDECLAKGSARAAGAEVPAAIGDPLNETDDADGLFDFVRRKSDLRSEWKERIAELRVEYGLDEPESPDP